MFIEYSMTLVRFHFISKVSAIYSAGFSVMKKGHSLSLKIRSYGDWDTEPWHGIGPWPPNLTSRPPSLHSISQIDHQSSRSQFSENNDRVPTRTGKPGKMGRHFPVREKSGNFEQTGKVRENHTKYWKTEINII